MRVPLRYRAWATACLTYCALGCSVAVAQDLEARQLEWNQCVERRFLEATRNSIDKELALEFAFGVCRAAENALIASTGRDFAAATRMIAEAKAAAKRRLLTLP
jgi:hypothetical protein